MAALILNELDYLDSVLYYPVLVVVLVVAGLYFSWRTRLVQLRMCAESIRVVLENRKELNPYRLFRLLWYLRRRVSVRGILSVFLRLFVSAAREAFFGCGWWLLSAGPVPLLKVPWLRFINGVIPQGGSYGGPAYYIENSLCTVVFYRCWFFAPLFLIFDLCRRAFNLLASYNLRINLCRTTVFMIKRRHLGF